MAVRPYILPLHTISPLGGGWWSPAVRAFGGGSPVREVGTSSCWAPPPSRQPQRGPAAPYHGRLGATTRWGDKVRVEGPANGVGSSGYFSPAHSSHHCDAQGAQGVKGPSPELAWSPQVRSYLTVCTCGREPSWESRYTQQRRRWRKPPTIYTAVCGRNPYVLELLIWTGLDWGVHEHSPSSHLTQTFSVAHSGCVCLLRIV